MVLIRIKLFFCRGDVRIIIFGTLTGAILQSLYERYLKNHPEFLKDSPESKETLPRGGGAGEIVAGKVIVQAILTFLADHGLTAGLISSTGVVISQIPVDSISTYLRDAFPQNLLYLEKKNLSWLMGKNIFRPMRPKPKIFI